MTLKTVRRACKSCGGSGTIDEILPESARAARKEKGLTLKALADRMGIHSSYCHDLETGKRPFIPKQAAAFRKALEEK